VANNTNRRPWSETFTAIGRFGRSHGLKGDVLVYPYGNALHYLEAPFDFITDPLQCHSVRYCIESLSKRNNAFAAHIQGFDTKEDAARFSGYDLVVAHASLPALEQNEYYHFELKGMTVTGDPSGAILGIVDDVYSFPSADALQYHTDDNRTLYVPFTADAVVRVDKKERTIFINEHFCSDII
jgi:16S rRNA processing protein RimM